MTSTNRKPRIASPPLLIAAAAFISFGLADAFLDRHNVHSGVPPTAPIVASRLLRFSDRADGAVVVSDASNGHTLAVATGQSGFLRCTLAGFTRVRQTNSIGQSVPFTLTLFADRRLTLSDPTTSLSIELEAFGQTNESVFAQFLQPLGAKPSLLQAANDSSQTRSLSGRSE